MLACCGVVFSSSMNVGQMVDGVLNINGKAVKKQLLAHNDTVEIGKYNAGQKIVFWGMSLLILVLIASGLVIWEQYFSSYTSITQKRLAVLVHAIAAVTIICVWIVHVYAAIWVRGTFSAMTRGQVTGGWAWRHHRRWLKELVTGKPSS